MRRDISVSGVVTPVKEWTYWITTNFLKDGGEERMLITLAASAQASRWLLITFGQENECNVSRHDCLQRGGISDEWLVGDDVIECTPWAFA